MSTESIIARFGGDTTGLREATEEGKIIIKGFSTQASRAFGEIGRGFVAAVAISEIVKFTREAINEAQKVRDEFDKIGHAVDGSTRSMAEFGDTIDNVKKVAVSTTSYIVGGWTQLVGVISSATLNLVGFTEASEIELKLARKIAVETEKNMADIAAAKKKFEEDNSPEKRIQEENRLAEIRRKNQEEQLSGEARLNALYEDQTKILNQITRANHQTVEYYKLREDLSNKANEISKEAAKQEDERIKKQNKKRDDDADYLNFLNKLNVELLDKQAAADKKRLDAQYSITREFEKQLKLINEMAGGGKGGFISGPNGGGLATTTVSELDNKLRNAQGAFEYLKQNPNDPDYSKNYIAARDLITKTQADLDYAKMNTATIGSGYAGGIPLGQLPSNQALSYGTGIDLRAAFKPQATTGYNGANLDIVKMGDNIGSILDTLTTMVGEG